MDGIRFDIYKEYEIIDLGKSVFYFLTFKLAKEPMDLWLLLEKKPTGQKKNKMH